MPVSRIILIDENTQEQGIALEGTSSLVEAQFVDRAGENVDLEAFSTLTCTLTNAIDGSVINSRSSQSILNANDGTVSDTGYLVLKLGPADNVIVSGATEKGEVHFLQLDWTYTDTDTDPMTGQANFQFIVWPDQLSKGTDSTKWLTA